MKSGLVLAVFLLSTHVIAAPQRIVTLAPSLGEIAAEILETDLDRIVGVSEYTDFPSALKKKPIVGSYARFSLEKVLALQPDLVLATRDGNPKEQIERLKALNVPVHVVDARKFSDVAISMQEIGKLLGREEAGNRTSERFKKGLMELEQRMRPRLPEGASRIRVALQIGNDPIVMAGRDTFLHEALTLLGTENVFGDAKESYPRPSAEQVLKRNPDVIIILAMTDDLEPFQKAAGLWKRLKGLKAAQSDRVLVLRADGLIRPSSRLMDGLLTLEKILWSPDRKVDSK